MKKLMSSTIAASALILSTLAVPAVAQESGVEIGQLNCEVAGGAGFIFGSSKNLSCTFTSSNTDIAPEVYSGDIKKFGIDIGVTGKSVILWTVVSAKPDIYEPGSLEGTYAGGTASAAFVAGLGANVLLGGSEQSFALQPISVSASTGVNVAVGLAQVTLTKMQ